MIKGKVVGNSLVKKIEYFDEGRFYYSVPFSNSPDSLDVCVSTQIGCPMKCTFCATGDTSFVRDLNSEEIMGQILDSVESMEEEISKRGIKKLKVIAEGMGESSFNIGSTVLGFQDARNTLFSEYGFNQIDFGVSTVGNPFLIEPYRRLALSDLEDRTSYDFQISLHSANQGMRSRLIPNMPRVRGQEFDLGNAIDDFCGLAKDLGQPMKFNYLLLNSPDGWTNYDSQSLDALVSLCERVRSNGGDNLVKLTEYSDTKKGFSSPGSFVYQRVIDFLSSNGIMAYHVPLIGEDIMGACGQLHYKK